MFDTAGFSVHGPKHSESMMPYDLGDPEKRCNRAQVHLPTFDVTSLPPPQGTTLGTKVSTESAPSTQVPLKITVTVHFGETPDLFLWLLALAPWNRGPKLYKLAGKGFRLENSGWKPPKVVPWERSVSSAPLSEYRYPQRITLKVKGHPKDMLAKHIFAVDEQKRAKRLLKLAKGGVVLDRLQRSSGAMLLPKELRLEPHAPNVRPNVQKLHPANRAPSMADYVSTSGRARISLPKGNGYGEE